MRRCGENAAENDVRACLTGEQDLFISFFILNLDSAYCSWFVLSAVFVWAAQTTPEKTHSLNLFGKNGASHLVLICGFKADRSNRSLSKRRRTSFGTFSFNETNFAKPRMLVEQTTRLAIQRDHLYPPQFWLLSIISLGLLRLPESFQRRTKSRSSNVFEKSLFRSLWWWCRLSGRRRSPPHANWV